MSYTHISIQLVRLSQPIKDREDVRDIIEGSIIACDTFQYLHYVPAVMVEKLLQDVLDNKISVTEVQVFCKNYRR